MTSKNEIYGDRTQDDARPSPVGNEPAGVEEIERRLHNLLDRGTSNKYHDEQLDAIRAAVRQLAADDTKIELLTHKKVVAERDAAREELKAANRRNDDMHAIVKSDYWSWMDDGNDHPESLANGTKVMMRGEVVRRMAKAEATLKAAGDETLEKLIERFTFSTAAVDAIRARFNAAIQAEHDKTVKAMKLDYETGCKIYEQTIDAERQKCERISKAWEALENERQRIWPGVKITHAGRCGKEMNALEEALRGEG